MKISRAYLAGLIDGEGSVSIYRRYSDQTIKSFVFSPVFKIGMTGEISFEIIRFIQGKYGGDLWVRDYNNGYKPCMMLAIKGKKILPILKDIYPFLIVKKPQAQIVYEYFSGLLTQKSWKSPAMPESEYQRRSALYEKMKILNKKGTKESVAETK